MFAADAAGQARTWRGKLARVPEQDGNGADRVLERGCVTATKKTGAEMVRAVLTDVHFWVPAAVLALGVLLLIALH